MEKKTIDSISKQSKREKYVPLQGKASRIALTVLCIVLCVIFVPILICNSVLIIKGLANPDEVPSIFNISPMIIVSGSMEDTIMKGDLVFIKKIDTDEIKKGDIIAFFEDKFVVTHRVIDVQIGQDGQKSFQTKGDHNVSPDLLPVLPENVVGIYIGRIPKMGDFAVFLQTPVGMIVFIGAPILIYLVVVTIRREIYVRRNMKDKKEDETRI
jgi:signal peptidase